MFENILIVDDNALVLKAAERSLRRSCTVHTAANREQALDLVRGKPIDLAFVDLFLDGCNGIALIRELKTVRSDLVAVLMSSYATLDVAVDAGLAGAVRAKLKPFDYRTVVMDLESKTPPDPKRIPKLSQVEREYIQRVLDDCDGNVSRAASCLGMARSLLYRKLRRLGIELKKIRWGSAR